LSEAAKLEYFVDGFLIKHFGIWPIGGSDKNDLFEEQKVFLVYLMGMIPSNDEWAVQVDYKTKLQEIKDMKSVEIEQGDIDLAKLQGRNIGKLKKERLEQEKEKRILELNEKFGIKEKIKQPERPEGLPEKRHDKEKVRQEKLWDLLQGKGLVEGDGL